jgi:ceramide glucosyltransferase
MIYVLLGIALLGTLTSTIFLGLVLVASARFKRTARERAAQQKPTGLPPVSLIKPLHGAEPELREYLESFFALDYPDFEILFCARTEADLGLQLAREVAARHPRIPVRFLLSGVPPWPNARCYSVSIMARESAHDLLVVTDSDVRVRPQFLREVVASFADPGVGALTCLYRGDATGMGLWALMEGMGMSVEMTAGVVVADMLEGMKFTLGPCMAVRKEALSGIGGFDRLGYYYADDFMLGNLVAENGHEVVLSSHVIDHCIVNDGFWRNFSHQWSWMKSTRFSRPWGHLGTGLTFAAPFGLLGLLGGYVAGMPELGWLLLGWAYVSRVLLSLIAGGWVVGDPDAFKFCWLYPLRDLMGAVLWAASYTSRQVGWRDDRFVLEKGGLMRKIDGAASGGTLPEDSSKISADGR